MRNYSSADIYILALNNGFFETSVRLNNQVKLQHLDGRSFSLELHVQKLPKSVVDRILKIIGLAA